MAGKSSFVYLYIILGFCCMVCDSQTAADCNTADGVASWKGDGTCDPQNLISECDWDGGDCCICTCEDEKYACGTDGYLCLDPTVLGNDTCGEESLPACPVDDQYFVVGNTTDVQDMAATMINCSGGTFHVEWRGNIMVDTEIMVSYGTFLNVTGVGSSAVLDGGGGTRLFRVVNASLLLDDVEIRNGNATFGGAIAAIDSTLALHRTSFINNTAFDKNGGAVFVYRSILSLSGQTEFFNNSADYGGALYAASNSSVLWEGVSNFTGNSASHSGGAIGVVVGSTVSWGAETIFEENVATDYRGGALFLEGGSSASWNEEANFIANSALLEGGAMFLDIGSNASWRGSTMFHNNSVKFGGGGAILIGDSSTVELRGETKFEFNSCSSEGGAVSSNVLDSKTSILSESSFVITGTTIFSNNQCGSNGGGVALLSGLSASFESRNITFVGNEAGVAGGGVFLSTTGEGPNFSNTTFISNSAEVGGGVYISGSGTSLDDDPSATFDNCTFSGNKAEATGGAVEIATGVVAITNTVFRGNKAKVGGALWLAGAAFLENCLFVENVSDEGGGQAVTTIGSDFEIDTCSFIDNLYDCEPGTYLDESESGDRFKAVCLECGDCPNCVVENDGTKPACPTALEHTNSSGGTNATLETLLIARGYWRATNDSVNILACYNEDACEGGLTTNPDFCQMGYKGPYCSVCIDNYAKGMGFTCTRCSENIWGIVVAVTTLVISVLIAFTAVKYVMSIEKATRPGIIARIFRRVPLQSVKLVIVAWQILTQFTIVADVTFPDLYQRFLNFVDIFNFDLTWMISAGCFIAINFHGQLLILTIGPIAVMLFLGGTYTYVKRKHHASEEALMIARHKHVSIMLLIMFLVYSSTSSIVFQMFDCEQLDDGKDYLRADYTIECDSPKHRALMVYAGFMLVLYPLGIPAFFAYLLFQNRKVLTDEASREEAMDVKSISDLWKPYKPSRFYFEVIECCRRIVLTGAVLLVDDDSAAQIAVTLILAFVFTVVSEGLAPYESQLDTWVSRLGHAVVVATMYYALLLKVNVSAESHASQRAFDIVLIVIHVAMVLLVIGEAFITTYSLNQGQVEDPWPRIQRYRSPRIYFTTQSMSDVSPRNHEFSHFKEAEIGDQRPAPLRRGERLHPL